MLKLIESLRERRSIRKYQHRAVPEEAILAVLTAAGWAPSAHNAQPWRFIVVTDAFLKRNLAEEMSNSWSLDVAEDGLRIEPEQVRLRIERFASAPVLILGCLSMEGMATFADERRQICEHDLAMQSLATSLQNLLLAAHAKGLGACWFCAPAFCKEAVRDVLLIPSDVDPEALIVLGYPAENPAAPPRRPLADFCFKDKWGGKLA